MPSALAEPGAAVARLKRLYGVETLDGFGTLSGAEISALGLIAACAFVGGAQAGGLERGGYNIDLLFDPGQYVFESGVTYVAPDRSLNNAVDRVESDSSYGEEDESSSNSD
jgi:long-subunit fatty acid transport protein